MIVSSCILSFGCKKNNSQSSSTNSNTSNVMVGGVDTVNGLNLFGPPYAQDIDTSLLTTFSMEVGRSFKSTTLGILPVIINVPPPLDYGQAYKDCIPWALGYGLLGYYYNTIEGNISFAPIDTNFSPSFIYNQLNGGNIKNDISIFRAFDFVMAKGCSRWAWMPYDPPSATRQPSPAAIQDALNYPISRAYPFLQTDIINWIKKFLAKKYPLVALFKAYPNLSTNDPCCVSIANDGSGRHVYNKSSGVYGWHAVLLCGYDDNIKAFKALNSWGKQYGDGGYYWFDYNYLVSVLWTGKDGSGHDIYGAFLVLPRLVTLNKPDPTLITNSSAVMGGFIVSDPNSTHIYVKKGVCFNTSPSPTINDNKVESPYSDKGFQQTLNNLMSSTNYYARAYAYASDTIIYGNQISFTTTEGATTVIDSVYGDSAILGGHIPGIWAGNLKTRGVCWSTSQNPTIANSFAQAPAVNGHDTGSFTVAIGGLLDSAGPLQTITYYARTYVTDGSGDTLYGNQLSFTTQYQLVGNYPGTMALGDFSITRISPPATTNLQAFCCGFPYGIYSGLGDWGPAPFTLHVTSASNSGMSGTMTIGIDSQLPFTGTITQDDSLIINYSGNAPTMFFAGTTSSYVVNSTSLRLSLYIYVSYGHIQIFGSGSLFQDITDNYNTGEGDFYSPGISASVYK
jgi:hypothetical protein